MSKKPLTFALIGAGSRGQMFAQWILDNEGPGALVAIAEPRERERNKVGDLHSIQPSHRFESWTDLLAGPKLADVLINATMDKDHLGSAIAALSLGYHMLIEKPLATTLADVKSIDNARKKSGKLVAVCHSLRHNSVYEKVKSLIDEGTIGQIVSIDQLEAVELVHQSHSFVRGNWGNSERSTFMLLAKSCHDLDVIAWLIGEDCLRVSSFGSLSHFRTENAPQGAPDFCVQGCPVEKSCPFYAPKLYGEPTPWQKAAALDGLSKAELTAELSRNRYGRCVYKTDNDVVDHQVVNFQFAHGKTATFTMTGFTPWGGRYLRVHGERGYLEAKIDQRQIDVWEFWKENQRTTIEVPKDEGAHGGGDARLISAFVEAVRSNNQDLIRTGTQESLRTHAICFAAEEARLTDQVVEPYQPIP